MNAVAKIEAAPVDLSLLIIGEIERAYEECPSRLYVDLWRQNETTFRNAIAEGDRKFGGIERAQAMLDAARFELNAVAIGSDGNRHMPERVREPTDAERVAILAEAGATPSRRHIPRMARRAADLRDYLAAVALKAEVDRREAEAARKRIAEARFSEVLDVDGEDNADAKDRRLIADALADAAWLGEFVARVTRVARALPAIERCNKRRELAGDAARAAKLKAPAFPPVPDLPAGAAAIVRVFTRPASVLKVEKE